LTNIKTRRIIDNIVKELRLVNEVKKVQTIRPISDDTIVDDSHFPPLIMGERALIMSRWFYESFIQGGYTKFGNIFSSWLYVIGSMIGKNAFRFHLQRCYKQYDCSESEGISAMIKFATTLFKYLGFGILKIEKLDLDKNEAIVRVHHSFECELFKENRKVSSHFVRGLLAGWFSELCGKELFAEEFECIAKDNEFCRFRIAGRPHPIIPLRLYNTSQEY
jgi:predicted hydrocarbon binding protein